MSQIGYVRQREIRSNDANFFLFQGIICDLRIYPLKDEDNVSDLCSFVEPSCEVFFTYSIFYHIVHSVSDKCSRIIYRRQ